MDVQERYDAVPMAADTSRSWHHGSGIAGFIAVTAGTITVSRTNDLGVASVVLAPFPVAAGTIYGLPMFLGTNGFTVTLAGGASGTLLLQ